MTESELVDAPEKIKDFVRSLPKQSIEFIEITEESIELADRYIAENVVGKASREDCIRGYNSVNLKLGYPAIEVRSPKEMIDYENED